jgi:hypothetical protein
MTDEMESPEAQIIRLADFILAEVEGEPSQNEGAVDTAIRIMRLWVPKKGAHFERERQRCPRCGTQQNP